MQSSNAGMDSPHALQLAVDHHQAGRLPQAEAIYRQILAADPRQADALHLLGILAKQAGHLDAGIDLIRRAVAARPDFPEAWSNLGVMLTERRIYGEAITCCQNAIRLKPDFAAAHYNLANALRDNGQFDDAIATYQKAVAFQPEYVEAQVNLANLLASRGRMPEAVASFAAAVALRPGSPEGHFNLANALRDSGQQDAAVASFNRAIELRPDYPEACTNLGNVLRDVGRLDEAIASFRKAVSLKPDWPAAYCQLGNALRGKGELDEAIALFRKAIQLQPNYPQAYGDLGNLLLDKGQLDEAVASYYKAIELKPDFAEVYCNLGNALREQGMFDAAIVSCRKAMALKPGYARAMSNLGDALRAKQQTDAAIDYYRQAIALSPDLFDAHHNLASALKDAGQLDEAIACYRRSLSLRPESPEAGSNLLLALLYHPDTTAAIIYEQSVEWAARHADPLRRFILPHANDRSPGRRLRIAYVSPDLCSHVVGTFMLPLLAAHDHVAFEIFCYADVPKPDWLTEKLRVHADVWRSTVGLTDGKLTDLIRQDRIDVLIDLALHTGDNRLLVFARKPAPVQVTYLAYCATSGMQAIDYRITDPYLDPPGSHASIYTEKSLRLPQTYWCYQPSLPTAAPGPLPALASGQITFGSLNNFCKLSEPAWQTWCELLRRVPRSRLLVFASEGAHRGRLLDVAEANGLARARVTFVSRVPTAEYFELYRRIDIGLDPSPFNGGTTTCDALWMGVPVVSLAGQTPVSRGGLSILTNVGLPELVARTREEYVDIAATLAADLPRLTTLRETLRPQMRASPLMNAPEFARNIEAAYRKSWEDWCEGVS